MNGRTILLWETAGFFLIIVLGALLHFCFEWSGGSLSCALFCAVNESVWEHLKLVFWPGLLFAILEYAFWGSKAANFLVAKVTSLYIMPITIVALFYTYTAILGTHILAIDLLIFVISALFGQYSSFRIITSAGDYSILTKPAFFMLAILVLAFSLFTYCPPEQVLFVDPRTGKTGIPD